MSSAGEGLSRNLANWCVQGRSCDLGRHPAAFDSCLPQFWEGYVHPRPQTHDLLIDIIESLNASISEVCITDIQDKTYFAEITLSTIEGSVTLSSRPSDAIALAIRSNSKITVNPDLFNQNSIILIEDNNQEIKEFIEFIDDISPDDFV